MEGEGSLRGRLDQGFFLSVYIEQCTCVPMGYKYFNALAYDLPAHINVFV